MRGYLTLGDIASRTPTLAVACGRCDRRGHYRTDGLVRAHGAHTPVPEWLRQISADCPRRISPSPSISELCGVRCDSLAALFAAA